MSGQVGNKDDREMWSRRDARSAPVGVLGGPVEAALGAGAGGAIGYLTGDAVGISRENVEAMKSGMTANSSALAVALDDRSVSDIARGLEQAKARSVIASQIAPR